ncbi:Type II toxin-antitoxin system RelE/ParE family toxin [Petrocella atlantisensis]|uniref:Type II toxin-antitoxin system RelE/ParE family toxin n=1 Tax=Petrocella atlantisensis TaxID=2173034 RepID=A0A3P7P479_9FIRM|nr:type II toxin-antitoxin system RelE/ParE family toxin [Petrocella atlantisensis]VDN48370.1 Type II toxin-antitoxin system RelE/ParE family toxin [Petrocella atlantisensis]
MYQIVRTEKADNQLRDLIYYIADDSGSVDVALNYLDKLEKAMMRLSEFPESGSTPRYAILRKQGYRVLIVEKHLAFYKVDHTNKVVTIYAVVDSRQEYRNLI